MLSLSFSLIKGEAKLDAHVESASLRAVEQASSAIAVTKHKREEEKKIEEELEEAIEATKSLMASSSHGDSEAKLESALLKASALTNRAADDAKTERQHGSMTEAQIEDAARMIRDAETQAE